MTTQVQFRRGTTSQHGAFTGAVGEVTVDTDLDTLRVHDGAVAGGVRLAKFTDIAAQTIDISDSSSNTITLTPGSTDVTFIGNDITVAAAGNTMTFTLNDSVSVDEISSSNSSFVNINDGLNVNGNIQTTSGVVTAAGFTIGSAVINETDLELIDGLTAGTAIASKAVTTDANIDTTGQRNLTISGELDAATLDISGAIDVAGTSNLDVVDIDGAVDMASTLTVAGVAILNGGIDIAGDIVLDAGGADITLKDDGTTIGNISLASSNLTFSSSVSDKDIIFNGNDGGASITALTLDMSAAGAATFNSTVTATTVTATGFTIGSAVIDETDLEKLDGITNGTAAANKALVADANIDIGTIRNLSMTGNMDVGGDLQLDGNLTVSGTTNSVNTTTLEVADALLELNKNNSGGADIDGGILIQRGSAGNNAVFYWNEGDDKFKAVLSNSAGTATAVTDSSQATIVASIEGTTVTGTTVVGGTTSIAAATITNSTGAISFGNENLTTTGTINGGVITGTGFTIGSAAMNEADLEKIDGITNGTIAANKAVVADANKDVTTFRNCTATTFIGALTGNADTATSAATLTTARTIGGVSFNGSANINLPGVNSGGNQDTSGTAALATAVTVTANNTANETCFITFVDGATGTQGIETDTGLNYNPSTNVLATTAAAAQYSDVAEKYIGDAQYESGTVVIFGGDHEVTTTELTHDPRVAGVVSTAPAYLMNSHLEATYVIDLALTGRVPCKVKGVVAKGDLIVSSQTAGVGMKLQQESYNVGCVIGKALESKDTADVGVIEVVVGRL